jgi:hypothetical protein
MTYDQTKINQSTTSYRLAFPNDQIVLDLIKTVSGLRDRPGVWDRLVEAMDGCVMRDTPLNSADCRFVFGNPVIEYQRPVHNRLSDQEIADLRAQSKRDLITMQRLRQECSR